MPNNVKITNKDEDSKLEIKDVINGQTILIPFNEEIQSNFEERVEPLEENS
jgi:hypothetical protein